MNSLYHLVPPDRKGDTLYPLNQLKKVFPELYKVKVEKYVGREQLLTHVIPTLNCLWNDVLHLTAVHPQEVKEALSEAGKTNTVAFSFYQIAPHFLEPEKTTVFLYDETTQKDRLIPENFVPHDPASLEQYAHYSPLTKNYFKEMISAGKRPLLYFRTPHILYKGTINVTDLPIVHV